MSLIVPVCPAATEIVLPEMSMAFMPPLAPFVVVTA